MNPILIEATGYFATALNVAGNLMLAKMSIRGWIVRMVTNVVYIVYALQISQGLPVVANHVLFLGINAYGLWQWRRQAKLTPT